MSAMTSREGALDRLACLRLELDRIEAEVRRLGLNDERAVAVDKAANDAVSCLAAVRYTLEPVR